MDVTILNIEVDLLAVLAAAVAGMVIGSIWFMPQVMGARWMKLVGLSKERQNSGAMKAIGGAFVLALVTATVISVLVGHVAILNDYSEVVIGLIAGFIAWSMYATASLTNYLFSQKSFELWMLEASNQLITLCVMGVIVAVW